MFDDKYTSVDALLIIYAETILLLKNILRK